MMRTALTAMLLLALTTIASAEEAKPTALDTAWVDLEKLEDLLDDGKATNVEINAYLSEVVTAAKVVARPAAPEGREPTDKEARTLRDSEKLFRKYREATMELLFEALTESDLDRDGSNAREAVNRHAAGLLPQAATLVDKDRRGKMVRRILRKVKRMERARHSVHAEVFGGAFRTLAALGESRGLTWMMDNYMHTRKQPEEVAKLRQALRAMRQFKAIPARLRHDMLDRMRKRYVAMETLAEQSTTDIAALAAKRFWDQVRTEVIPLAQYLAGYPTDASGAALATMKELADWFREHDNLRDPVWAKAPVLVQ